MEYEAIIWALCLAVFAAAVVVWPYREPLDIEHEDE